MPRLLVVAAAAADVVVVFVVGFGTLFNLVFLRGISRRRAAPASLSRSSAMACSSLNSVMIIR